MSAQDLHEVIMKWPSTDANEVIVTGTFDQWSSSIRLARTASGFEAPVRIPWQDKITYKFIVDGRWVTDDSVPTEYDGGFINNVYVAPPKPEPTPAALPIDEPAAPEPAPEPTPAPEGNGSVLGAAQAFASQLDASYDAPTPAAEEPAVSKSFLEEAHDAAAPIMHAIHTAVIEPMAEFANQVHAPHDAPTPAEEEPAKSLVEEVHDVTANIGVVPDSPEVGEEIETEPKSIHVPEAVPVPEREVAPDVPIDIVPALLKEETPLPEATVVPGTTVTLASEAAPAPVEASTHILLGALKVPPTTEAGLPKVDVAPITIEADLTPQIQEDLTAALEPAPPVLAAEPVTEAKDAPKVVVEAEPVPVAAAETAAAPTSAVSVPENAVEEPKAVAPDVLAAPAPEAENKDVVPIEEHKAELAAALEPAPPVLAAEPIIDNADAPKEVVDAQPVAVVETAAASTSAVSPSENVAAEEDKVVAPEVLAAPAPEAEQKEVVPVEEPTATSADPKSTAGEASTASATNGHAKEATNGAQLSPSASQTQSQSQTNGSRSTTPVPSKASSRFAFPGRRASADKSAEKEKEKEKSPHSRSPSGSSRLVGSLRKKRPSLFGKLKDVFGGEKEKKGGGEEKK